MLRFSRGDCACAMCRVGAWCRGADSYYHGGAEVLSCELLRMWWDCAGGAEVQLSGEQVQVQVQSAECRGAKFGAEVQNLVHRCSRYGGAEVLSVC